MIETRFEPELECAARVAFAALFKPASARSAAERAAVEKILGPNSKPFSEQ
jgi:hypothetical protein